MSQNPSNNLRDQVAVYMFGVPYQGLVSYQIEEVQELLTLILDTVLALPELQPLPESYNADMSYALKQERLVNRDCNQLHAQLTSAIKGLKG